MALMETRETSDFHEALAAPGSSLEIPEASDLYGWLIGSWELDVLYYWVDLKGRGRRLR